MNEQLDNEAGTVFPPGSYLPPKMYLDQPELSAAGWRKRLNVTTVTAIGLTLVAWSHAGINLMELACQRSDQVPAVICEVTHPMYESYRRIIEQVIGVVVPDNDPLAPGK